MARTAPASTRAASRLLAHERDVLGVGVETVGTDAGQAGTFDPPFPNHTIMHGAGKFGLASLCNLDQLPADRRDRDRRAAEDRRRQRQPLARAGLCKRVVATDPRAYNGAMRRLVVALTCAALTVPGQAQDANSGSELEAILRFETEHTGTSPRGWGGPPGTIFVDGQIVHGGRWAVRLERDATSPSGFSTITKSCTDSGTSSSTGTPYRNVLDQDWSQVLAEFIPRIALAKDKDAYQLETIALIAKVTDTHANLWNAPPQLRPPAGDCQLPVTTRFIENRAVVTGYSEAAAGPATGLKIGDVIESLDGVPVEELVERWAPYYPASNQPTRLRDIARAMTRGACSAARVSVRRASQTVQITAQRQPLASLDQKVGSTHDLPGETFRLLSDQVAYLKLSSVQAAQASSYIDRAKGTKGLVIDIRNYPSEFVVFALGSLLVDRPTQFARFTSGDLDNPGAFRWSGEPVTLSPQQPHYSGKVVILVDEISQSQAEYTAMAFRSAPQAMVVGSTTAGADGNVSQVRLPGGLNTMISGIGVFYPDKRPTQRVGIVPDVEVRPTIAGIRAGRDEVLEEALRQILGRQTPADQIEKMARGGNLR